MIFRDAKTTSIPLVARMARELGLMANVLSASTQPIDGETYGSILLGVPHEQMDAAVEFLRSIPNMTVEEVTDLV